MVQQEEISNSTCFFFKKGLCGIMFLDNLPLSAHIKMHLTPSWSHLASQQQPVNTLWSRPAHSSCECVCVCVWRVRQTQALLNPALIKAKYLKSKTQIRVKDRGKWKIWHHMNVLESQKKIILIHKLRKYLVLYTLSQQVFVSLLKLEREMLF